MQTVFDSAGLSALGRTAARRHVFTNGLCVRSRLRPGVLRLPPAPGWIPAGSSKPVAAFAPGLRNAE